MYSYQKSVKSNISDELINVYLIRPLAGLVVWPLYYTSVTPNQVTIASTIAGLSAAYFYLKGTPEAFISAGLLVALKDILDSADGQLARAKQQYSRIGRFLDSIGDFIVNIAIFSAIGWTLYVANGNLWMLALAFLGFIGISLRVSYHVFYQVNFLHLQDTYFNNRISENILQEDLRRGGSELFLQKIFQFIYGWQDKLIDRIDRWSIQNTLRMFPETERREPSRRYKDWYSDRMALRLSGFLGFGTELFLLVLCSVTNQLKLYLYLNVVLMNGIMIVCVLYRRMMLAKKQKIDAC